MNKVLFSLVAQLIGLVYSRESRVPSVATSVPIKKGVDDDGPVSVKTVPTLPAWRVSRGRVKFRTNRGRVCTGRIVDYPDQTRVRIRRGGDFFTRLLIDPL